ncbi:hypothetical protein EDD37DRAFT_626971 [Exophiala viscosa]|uniref:uncharacterized protein n=1 Tax=Exophiala viscosa TaxID=2486360 RepID=UPI002195B925|nr:hypothetical protein EDD37DRAFT_626971 [Exophiala viscosa]
MSSLLVALFPRACHPLLRYSALPLCCLPRSFPPAADCSWCCSRTQPKTCHVAVSRGHWLAGSLWPGVLKQLALLAA